MGQVEKPYHCDGEVLRKSSKPKNFGFRVQDLGFGVYGFGFGVMSALPRVTFIARKKGFVPNV